MRPPRGLVFLGLVPLAFLGLFYVYPLGRILVTSFAEGVPLEIITQPRTLSSTWFTLWQAVASTLLTIVVAFPLTYVVAHYSFPGRRLVQALTTVPFVLPSMVVASAFVALGLDGSLAAILAAHVFYNVAVIVRTVGGLWSRLDPALTEAARTLGASPLRAFRHVALPLLRPALMAAAALVFVFTFTSFGVVLILGDLRYRTLEVEIYQRAVTYLDFPAASVLALFQLVVISGVVWWYGRRSSAMAAVGLVAESEQLRPLRGGRAWAGATATLALTLAFLTGPLLVLVGASLRGGAAGWALLFRPGPVAVSPAEAVANSLRFAVLATLLAVVVGTSAALVVARRAKGFGGVLDLALMLPLGTSAVTVGLGLLISWYGPLGTTRWLLPVAHALVAVPFVTRAAVPVLGSIRTELKEAAAVLGASPSRVWSEIDLPIAARALAVGAGFAAAVSIGEFGATAFLARPATTTVPYLIFRLLGRPGGASFAAAMAMAVVLMVLTAALTLAVDRLRTERLGSF